MRITSVPAMPAAGSEPIPNQNTINEPLKPTLPIVKEEIKPEEDPISAKYANFAKMEKLHRSKVQAREDALKQREEALKAKEAEYGANYVQKSKIPEYFQKGNLQDLGLTGDQVTHALLNQPSPQDLMIQELKAKVAALEGVPEQTKTLLEQRDKQAYDAAVNQIRYDVKEFIAEDPTFEIIKGTQSEDDIVELIKEKHEKEGTLLTIAQAAKIIEDKLFEGIIPLFEIPKVKQKLLEMMNPQVQAPSPKEQAPTKTLTHSQVNPAQRPISARERAILAYEGKLT